MRMRKGRADKQAHVSNHLGCAGAGIFTEWTVLWSVTGHGHCRTRGGKQAGRETTTCVDDDVKKTVRHLQQANSLCGSESLMRGEMQNQKVQIHHHRVPNIPLVRLRDL